MHRVATAATAAVVTANSTLIIFNVRNGNDIIHYDYLDSLIITIWYHMNSIATKVIFINSSIHSQLDGMVTVAIWNTIEHLCEYLVGLILILSRG